MAAHAKKEAKEQPKRFKVLKTLLIYNINILNHILSDVEMREAAAGAKFRIRSLVEDSHALLSALLPSTLAPPLLFQSPQNNSKYIIFIISHY